MITIRLQNSIQYAPLWNSFSSGLRLQVLKTNCNSFPANRFVHTIVPTNKFQHFSFRNYNIRHLLKPIELFHQPKTELVGIINGMSSIVNSALETAIVFIKRTFQPSIIRKKRKTGFLVRTRTVGGRRTLQRRKARGRKRLGGGI